jgi:hypothetical protein
MGTTEWTMLHRAARIACGELEGEASDRLERAVRIAWEAMQAGGASVADAFEYAQDSPPIPTYELWTAFAESSALRLMLADVLGAGPAVSDLVDLDDLMRYSFARCVADSLAVMPGAVREVSTCGECGEDTGGDPCDCGECGICGKRHGFGPDDPLCPMLYES